MCRARDDLAAKAGGSYVELSYHATVRMAQRGARKADVVNALLSATVATWQADHQTWLVKGGVDLDGDDLDVARLVEAAVLVITVK